MPTSCLQSERLRQRPGLTLLELLIVLAILAAVSTLVLPSVGQRLGEGRETLTSASLARLRDVVADVYCQDARREFTWPNWIPWPNINVSPTRLSAPQLRYLFVNPDTETATVTFDPVYKIGWRGPYVAEHGNQRYTVDMTANFTRQYGESGDPTVWDAWGRPIVIQSPGLLADGRRDVRLVSAGPNGVLDTPPDVATPALTAAQTGDDLIEAFGVR